MSSRNRIILFTIGLLLVAFGAPARHFCSILSYLIGYPILLISAFYFEKRKSRALLLYGSGILYFLVQMNWLATPRYHGYSIYLGYFILSFAFPYCFYFLGYALPKKAEQLSLSNIAWLALLYTVLEYSRLWILSGFPFHVTGLLLSSNIYTLQLASVVGLYGLSFFVIAYALFAAKCYFSKDIYKPILFGCMPFVLGFMLYNTGGYSVNKKEEMDIAVLQTGLLVEEKWNLENYKDSFIPSKVQLKSIWDDLENLPPTDLVILPEACLPGDGNLQRYTEADLKEVFPEDVWPFLSLGNLSNIEVFCALSIYLNTDIMAGFVADGRNSSFYMSKGKIQGRYDKRHLVPFGEYIPFKFLTPLVSRYGIEASFISGGDFSIIDGKCKILPTICFDEGFPDDFVKISKYYPDMHVNLSNDAWFLNSALARSHFDVGRLRSVENGIYSIRACNTGISAIISPKGEIRQKIEERDHQGKVNRVVMRDSFVLYTVATVFSRLGNLGLLLVLLTLLLLAKVFAKKVVSLKA